MTLFLYSAPMQLSFQIPLDKGVSVLCFPVTKSCPSLCNLMFCSTPGHSVSTTSWSLLKFMSIESVMLSNHLILGCPFSCLQSFPVLGPFPVSQLFASGWQSIGASSIVLPVNIQGWFPLELTALVSLKSKELWRIREYDSFTSSSCWSYSPLVPKLG